MGILERWDSRNAKAMKNANKYRTYEEFNEAFATKDTKGGRVARGIWSAQAVKAAVIGVLGLLTIVVWAVKAFINSF